MYKMTAAIAALTLMGAAALPLSANAAEHRAGATNSQAQSTEFSAQRHWRRHGYYYGRPYWGPRRYWGPRYGYYGNPYGYPYGYYGRPYYPGIALGIGPFGFRFF
jgi:hypothetical protein